MSVQKTGDIRRKVTSVGNSWIVCNSNSHPGLVYYFNTLSGEAVWNLSSAEIEKAKQRTKDLEQQSGAKPTRCPEPIQPPSSNLLNNMPPPEIQYINPFIVNTSNSSQNIAPFASTNSMLAQHISQISNPAVNVLNNLESLNSSISTLKVQATSIYNPKVWAVPHTQQVFIAPTPNLLGNHVNASANGPFNNYNQTMTQPLGLNNFGTTTQYNATRVTNQIYPKHNTYYSQRGQHYLSKNKQFNSHKKDLREKLFVRKRVQVSTEPGIGTKRKFSNSGDSITEENEEIDENHKVDILDKRSTETQMHEGPSKMDLTPLKSLAPINTKSEAWFIVTDFDVLVTEYKFLTALTDSDELCHLMVPRRVMSQLKNYVSSTADIQARRILRFLPQQIEIGYAFMAEEPLHDDSDSTAKVILTTCITLAKNNYHVILLSNDTELLGYKNTAEVNIFSIDEIKEILEKTSKKVVSPKKTFMFERLIKITVPNDTKKANYIGSSDKEIHPSNQNDQIYEIEPVTEIIKEDTEVLKQTVDAAIQTDFEFVNAVPSMVNDVQTTISTAQQTKELSTCSASSVTNVLNNKRKIKLNRSVSHEKPLPAAEGNVKQFKWRKRKNTTQVNTQTPTQCYQNTQPKTPDLLEMNKFNKDINKQAEKVLNDSPKVAQNYTKISDDSIDSKDSSIYIVNNKRKDNVTIAETSTSDIISNTESNLDSESNYSTTFVDQQQMVHENHNYESPMCEIDSENMEEYLIMKCDEWISRFIQIMEEVLTQVLQQKPSFSHIAMPPPWTLHEAAQCIAIKFKSHRDIKETANKLSSILFHISDSKGIIANHIKPCEYMQMYSYGVHLIEALSKEVKCCEDLQIAADSLKKLLEDIKNPNMDASTNDTFNESLIKKASAETLQHNISDIEIDSALDEKESIPDQNEQDLIDGPEVTQINTPKETTSPVKFIRNIDLKSSFFSNLRLKRVDFSLKDYSKTQEVSHEKQMTIDSQIEKEGIKNLPPVTEESENHQTVIRNFSICPKYEELFKSKNLHKKFEDHDDELDYEDDYDDGDYLTDQQDDAISDTVDMVETNEMSQPAKPDIINHDYNIKSSKKFKYVTYMLLKEIRTAVNQVRIFCEQCYEELQTPDLSMLQKREKLKMAETVHIRMDRLCKSLERMVGQEDDDADEKLRKILKQAGVNISHVDEKLIFQYRNAVSKSFDYAKTFLNAIGDVICAFKS